MNNTKIEALSAQYEALGARWLADEVEIESFNCACGDKDTHDLRKKDNACSGYWFNDKQKAFINSKSPELLISGGFRSGKTVAMIIKMWLLSMFFPGNRILLGRKTRSDIDSATLPAVFDVFPSGTYEYRAGPGIIEFVNGSQILLYGLDMQVSGDDTKKSSQKVKGLDLGGVFIDQLEEVDQKMYEQLSGRMSRNVPFHQMGSTTNPANFWAYDYFKANPRKGTEYIETGMIDNRDNLPDGFIEQQLTRGDMYVRRFVYGEWTPDVLVEGTVFGEDIVKQQNLLIKQPVRILDGIKIFKEPEQHIYQIGVDPSIGATDPCGITVVDTETGDVVATYSGFVNTDAIVEKTVQLAMMYSLVKKPLIIPEATGVGQALVESLKKVYDKIYEREVFNQRDRQTTKKLGFYTNYATKIQLIENFKVLSQKKFPKVRDQAYVDELKTFVYTDEAAQKGAGAQRGFHDDRVMSMLLAYWNVEAKSIREKNLLDRITRQNKRKMVEYKYT